jgi:hypothetical protein
MSTNDEAHHCATTSILLLLQITAFLNSFRYVQVVITSELIPKLICIVILITSGKIITSVNYSCWYCWEGVRLCVNMRNWAFNGPLCLSPRLYMYYYCPKWAGICRYTIPEHFVPEFRTGIYQYILHPFIFSHLSDGISLFRF